MTRSSVERTLWGILLLAGCAQSAIDPDSPLAFEGNPAVTTTDAGADAFIAVESPSLDAQSVDPTSVLDAAGESDAAGDLTNTDAGGDVDAAQTDAGGVKVDGGVKDASVDAATLDAAVHDASVVVPDAGATACPTGTERCGNACVDTDSESAHCGSCNTQCGSAEVCTAGSCVPLPPTAAGCTSLAHGGHNYVFCTSKSDDWTDARRSCINLGLDLAVVDDAAENSFVNGNNGGKTLWLGASDLDTEGKFLRVKSGDANSTKGTAIGYSNWASGEPNNDQDCLLGLVCLSDDEDCAQQRVDGYWNDGRCSNTSAWVCESY